MFLLDTHAVSELRKVRAGKADAAFARWAESASPSLQCLCVITVQALEVGVLRLERRDAAQGVILRRWLQDQVLPAFATRILPVTVAVARQAARFDVPDPKPARDGLIAAAASVHGLTLVTRNERDFVATGVPLLNPWGG